MNPSTALAHVLVDELVRLGCRHAVLCPGSRSAPLAYALADADAAGRLELHVRVDERAAAYLALGLAKGVEAPVPVVTTSGTAVAELHPAVLEASHGRVPLLLLTADRPPELRGTEANQTTDQVGLFGGAVRSQLDLGAPEPGAARHAVWRTTLDRAWASARGDLGGQRGPVHLNIPLRDPLAPDLPADGGGPEPLDQALAGRPDGAPWTVVAQVGPTALGAPTASAPTAPHAAEPLPDVPRTLVVLGDLDDPHAAEQVLGAAQELGWPVLAEPFGPRAAGEPLPHAPLLAGVPGLLEALPPARILVVGRLSLTRALAGLLAAQAGAGRPVELVTGHAGWPDPGHVATQVHPYAALAARARLGRQAPRADADARWSAGWARWGREVAGAVAAELSWADAAPPTGPALAAAVLAALPPGARLFLGSSNAARGVDVARTTDDLLILANRGLAGIDGCVSTAAGLALAGGAPTYALVGDLTFLHDANALLIGPSERRPDLTVIVANDDGGGIFGTLEYGEPGRERHLERVFLTPTGTDLALLAAAHGVPLERVGDRGALARALAAPPSGLRVLEVPVARGSHRAAYARLRAHAAAARLPR